MAKLKAETTKGRESIQPPKRQPGCGTAASRAQTACLSALCLNHRAIKLIGISVWFFPQEHLFPCVVNSSLVFLTAITVLAFCKPPYLLFFALLSWVSVCTGIEVDWSVFHLACSSNDVCCERKGLIRKEEGEDLEAEKLWKKHEEKATQREKIENVYLTSDASEKFLAMSTK